MAMVVKMKEAQEISPAFEIITITPAMASSWLEASKFDNRRVDDRNVDKIARDIKAGKWIFDGNPIRFDSEGNIVDGQHRLWGIITSGKAIQSAVVRGLSEDAKNVIDTGKARSNHDILHFNGYKNNLPLATATRLWIGYRTNGRDMKKWASSNSSRRLSINEILREIKTTPGIPEAVQATLGNKFSRKLIGNGTAAFCFYILNKIDSSDCNEFFYLLDSGADLHDGNPILALRNWLMVKDYKSKNGGNVQIMIKMAVIIKAWNAFRKQRSIQRLSYAIDKEAFPTAE